MSSAARRRATEGAHAALLRVLTIVEMSNPDVVSHIEEQRVVLVRENVRQLSEPTDVALQSRCVPAWLVPSGSMIA